MLFSQVASPPRVGLRAGLTIAMAAALCGAFTGAVLDRNSSFISEYFLVVQDAPVLFLFFVFFGVLRFVHPVDQPRPAGPPLSLPSDARWRWGAAALVLLLVVAGTHYVTENFPLSLDEFWADFDAKVIAHGHLLAPVAPEWRDYVPALQPTFRREIAGNAFWMSNYLPMNAALRAVFAAIGEPALAGACLAAVAVAALAGIARRLWPERPDAAFVSVILLATSSQFLVTAMTPYAMTAHLAFNLVWLWLFLRDTRLCHGAAIVAAFVACGLHQVVFHPLFAAPFIAALWFDRRWKLALCYTLAYAAIGLFWLSYWNLLFAAAGIIQSADAELSSLPQRIAKLIDIGPGTIGFMVLNLYRFIAWLSPLLVPLAIVGVACPRPWKAPLTQLAMGIALTVLAVTVLMPFQGHGWGYRYLHGLLGSFALLAAEGWVRITDRGGPAAKAARTALLSGAALSFFVVLPWLGYHVHAFIRPYADAASAIAHTRADIVIVDPTDSWYGADLVRNDPFLRMGPKVLSVGELQEPQIRSLCARYDVALFGRQDMQRYGVRKAELPAASEGTRNNLALLRGLGCGHAP